LHDLEDLYLKLPISLQHVACSARGWHVERTRYSRNFERLSREADRRAALSSAEIEALRDDRLAAFARHAAQTVPFYGRLFAELGIGSEQLTTLEALQGLPVLSKGTIQANFRNLESSAVRNSDRVLVHTSGTTGAGLRFTTTKASIQEQWAIWWRYRRWHGIDRRTWCGYFGGRSVVPASQTSPPFWRYNYPGRQIVFSAYHLSDANLQSYVDELRRRRPPWLHGYPSLLSLVASHLIDTGGDLGYELRWVTTGAETLRPQQSAILKRAFGVQPRQHYGMTEAVANFSECENGMLHVDEDFCAVEFIPTGINDSHRIVGTNLTNPSTPFFRYDTQDLATLASTTCSCGRPGRIVSAVDGRVEDYVVLKNGSRLGRMDHIFKDMTNIREAQIVQKQVGSLEIRIVRGSAYAASDESALLRELRKRIGDGAEVELSYVDRLERSRTGKLRFVVSESSRAP
jgi:phenylacetate-CoA ligase